MNLLLDKWIPVTKRESSTIEFIAPHDLTLESKQGVVTELAYAKPELNGSVMQFLIGWLQTVVPKNEDEDDWEDLFINPPSCEQLKSWSAEWVPAFELDGDGPRFMQDASRDVSEGTSFGIGALLMDSPGGNALKLNTDHFIKRDLVSNLSFAMAAAALYNLQLNAPSGGQGHRTSMRGGGPLTTLVVPDTGSDQATLWRSLWINVFDWSSFSEQYDCERPEGPTPEVFPWLGQTRTSDPKKEGQITTPDNVHPLQMYWSMPRRIRLKTDLASVGCCDLSGVDGYPVISHYHTKNFGTNYEGAWNHPLSPYYFDKDGNGLPMHAQSDGFNYRHWIGLIAGKEGSKTPARVIYHAMASGRLQGVQLRVWAFGYDMDNMKAVAWYESTYPIYSALDSTTAQAFNVTVQAMIGASDLARTYLQKAVKAAWFRRPGEKKGDTSVIDLQFWRRTETNFYSCLDELHNALKIESADTQTAREVVKRRWWNLLKRDCINQFDMLTSSCNFRQADPKRIAIARGELLRSIDGKKMRLEMLDLPVKDKENTGASAS